MAVIELVPDVAQEQEEEAKPAFVLPPRAERALPWSGIASAKAADGDLLTSQEMLEKAGLDWDVAVRPLWRRLESGEFVQHPRSREVYRTDTEETFGSVEGRYEPFSNREAFAFGDSLVTEGAARWAEAGQQRNGSRVFMTLKLEDEMSVLDGDAYDLYMFIRAGHDGWLSVTAGVVPFRAACLNQHQVALRDNKASWTIRHTSSIRDRMEEARMSLQMSRDYVEEFKGEAEKLAAFKVGDRRARNLVSSLISPARKHRDEVVDEILGVYNTSETVAPYHGTGYGLLNGVTEWADHVKGARTPNARFESVMFGAGAKMRDTLARRMAALN